MGLLDDIIEGASSDSVTTTNLLRKVQTLAHRLGATDLRNWTRSELLGYEAGAELPSYRGPFVTNVIGVYSGPGGASGTNAVSSVGVPEEHLGLFRIGWRVSIVEVEMLARSTEEIGEPWDPHFTALYNELIDEGRVPRIGMLHLYSARKVVSKAMLQSIVEAVRTQALDLALDLQVANPSAGEVGGPTLADAAVSAAVVNNIVNIHGDGANVAQGDGVAQYSALSRGDLPGFENALRELLEQERSIDDVVELAVSSASPQHKRSKLESVAAAIRDGSITVVSGITADVAADRVLALARQFLGWS